MSEVKLGQWVVSGFAVIIAVISVLIIARALVCYHRDQPLIYGNKVVHVEEFGHALVMPSYLTNGSDWIVTSNRLIRVEF